MHISDHRESPLTTAKGVTRQTATQSLPVLTDSLERSLKDLVQACNQTNNNMLCEHSRKVSLPQPGEPFSLDQADCASALLFVTAGTSILNDLLGPDYALKIAEARTNVLDACVGDAEVLKNHRSVDWQASEHTEGLVLR